MPAVSRIAFALYDLAQEIKSVAPHYDRPDFLIEVRMDHQTATAVERELLHHHGAEIQRDKDYRDPLNKAWKYAGMRLVSLAPGNRDA